MDITKKDRNELKSYFITNAKPSQDDFAALVDAMLNQKDDGLFKAAGNPLCIEASGDGASEKKTVTFYESFTDADPAWILSLNPRAVADDPATAQAGFNVADGSGNSRLFICGSSGNVGIGTSSPEAKLHVAGGLAGDHLTLGSGGTRLQRIVAGMVSATGDKLSGTGFTATRDAVGKYTVTFESAFADSPVTIATCNDDGDDNVVNVATYPGYLKVTIVDVDPNTNFVKEDGSFSFVAIGVGS
jgi:hypothetical protein